ncbi:SMI1/KNR4 family protein [Peribacillus sp. ACCC06369]|uniref:SMI1/KNR4 family protein n=1 Tax=Peribacillus sp. ACCC06369 TaxID=3055860 RepID=UPI0025A19E35|nr:SMI1/KNR4 family protein [Peribacillus sp. ACCC06369]MDM5358771.1 SMI1/KNR4 family protein [Peribacillus sp. ACCC06369]
MGLKKWLFVEEEKPDEGVIASIERVFEIEYPDDYKMCVMRYNGGFPEPNIFNFGEGQQGVFNDLISFTDNDINIGMFYELFSSPTLKGIVPFARDPFGSYLCFDYRNNYPSPKIIFFNHEEEALSLVCDTFSDLLEQMYSLEDTK